MKMLILEDDFFHRKLMVRLLAQFGECDVSSTGPECVDVFTKALANDVTFDVVFLDIMVPGMDGQKVLRAIRDIEQQHDIGKDHPRRAKVVMVTALSDKQNITTAYQESCDAYLIKPYDEAKLVDTLRKLGLDVAKK